MVISDEDFDNLVNDIKEDEENKEQTPQVPVENVDKPQAKSEEPMDDSLADLFEWSGEKVDVNGPKEKPTEVKPAKVAPIEYSEDDSLELLNSLSDLGSTPEEEPEQKLAEDKPSTESVAQPVQAEVKTPTPKTVYEPSQELTSESYLGETGSFDDSERMPDDFLAVLDENSSDKDESENLTETPAQVPVQNVEAPQAKVVEDNRGEQIEMPEDLFLEDFSEEKSTEAEVKPVKQAKTIEDDLKNSPVENQTNYQKRTPYISFKGITWKRGVSYCVGGLAIFFGAYFSAPILEKYVQKFNDPVQEKTVNTTPSQLETTAQEAQSNPAENYQEPSTTNENSTGTNNTETKTNEKPSLKELFKKRYHK